MVKESDAPDGRFGLDTINDDVLCPAHYSPMDDEKEKNSWIRNGR